MTPLQSTQPVTQKGDLPSADLVLVIQRLVKQITLVEAENRALATARDVLTSEIAAVSTEISALQAENQSLAERIEALENA